MQKSRSHQYDIYMHMYEFTGHVLSVTYISNRIDANLHGINIVESDEHKIVFGYTFFSTV